MKPRGRHARKPAKLAAAFVAHDQALGQLAALAAGDVPPAGPDALTLQDLDRFIGWTLVAIAPMPQAGTRVRLKSPAGPMVDVAIESRAAFTVSVAAVALVVSGNCPKSPLGVHALRPALLDLGPGRIMVDPTKPRTCILCGQTEEPQ